MTTPRKVRWLIAHQPLELFVRTATAFRKELNKRIPGQIDIEIITVPEYMKEHEGNEIGKILDYNTEEGKFESAVEALFEALATDIQISQTQIITVAMKEPTFMALDLPFMFDSHEHCTRVVEGPIGQELLANLDRNSDVKGLAFTYSGGYRVIGSNEKISNLAELTDKRVIVSSTGARSDTLKSVGAEPLVVSPHIWGGWDKIPADGSADAIETTYLRYVDGKYILKTNHSMFMTTILTNKSFWNSLTAEQQTAFEEAAVETAAIERDWAIEDARKYEENCAKKGIEITDLSESDEKVLKHKARYSYLQFSQEYGDLIKRIRQS
jgi:TRAP-type C4-dicarboxylate transport system substrate-binding protein